MLFFENHFFIKIDPEEFRFEYLDIAPKSARSAENVKGAEKSYRVNVFSHFGNGQFSQHRLQARAVRKHFEDLETCAYHVNVFPSLEMAASPSTVMEST